MAVTLGEWDAIGEHCAVRVIEHLPDVANPFGSLMGELSFDFDDRAKDGGVHDGEFALCREQRVTLSYA